MATIGLSNSIVEHVYNPQAQFHPTRLEVNEEGGAFSTPPFQSTKLQKQQRVFVYEENPLPREQERVLKQAIPGRDGRKPVVETTKWPHRVIAQISIIFNGQTYGGSGSLVGPHHVLTCGHNVYDTDQNIWAEEITVHPALNDNHAPFGYVQVVKVYTFTQYINQKDEKYDIALLILGQSIGKYTGWSGLLSAPDHRLSQAQVSIVGYPGDKGTKQMWGMKHKIQKIEPDLFQYLIDTAPGQSGSGIWIGEFALPMIVGIHIQGHNHANLGVRLSRDKFEVLVDKIAETFIREKARAQQVQPLPSQPITSHTSSIFAPLTRLTLSIFQQPPQSNKPALIKQTPIPAPIPTPIPQPVPVTPKPTIIQKLFPPVLPPIAFGKAKWAQYFGDVGIEPPLPSNIHEILNAQCPFWPHRRVRETHLLTLIPHSVDGKLFTLNHLFGLIRKPLGGGKATTCRYYWEPIQKEYGNTALDASYWVLLTKDIIPRSRNKKYDAQRQHLASYSQESNFPYEVPLLLETATSILMEHVQRSTHLYSNKPWTYTRCQERLSSYPNQPLIVGSFSAAGLQVDGRNDFAFEDNGIGGCLKF